MTAATDSSLVKCSKCQTLLSPEQFNVGELTVCPSCESLLEVEVFPAILATTTASIPEALLAQGESSCFYHPGNKAAIVCGSCGRFLCGLCDLEINGRHICPACLESGQKKAKFKELENKRVRYDIMALSLSVWPLLFYFISLVTAPITLYIVVRYWKSPCGLAEKSYGAFVLAAILALLEIGVWFVIFGNMFFGRHR